jgi:general secretion pathway protein B
MSFILDALKKSESDRQRQSGPSLFEVKVAPPQRKLPVWAVAIAVLLLVNVIVISWMLLRHPGQQASPAGSPATAPATTMVNPAATAGAAVPQTPPGSQAPRRDSAPGRLRAESARPPGAAHDAAAAAAPAAFSQQPATGPGQEAQEGQPPGSDSPIDHAPAVEPAAGAAGGGPAGMGGVAAAGLPLYQQIVTSDGLPELHLDLHVFADRPRDRFVMINMHRLGEGDSLPGGVQVETIRPDGVVLSYRGTRFLLPRSN